MKRREVIKGLTLLPVASGISSAFARSNNSFLAELSADGPLVAGPQVYQSIGVEPIINCRGTITTIGGSTELPEVKKAMEFASRYYVQIDELAMGVGKRLAELTGAEWAMVSAGCSAGLKHVTAACVTGGDPEKLVRIPNLEGFEKTEVIIPKYSRTFYDHAVRNIGVRVITVSTAEELADAISPRTAMIYMKAESPSPLTVAEVAAIARPKRVPILVDAAAFDLTIPNIHLEQGASIVAYSGGKALRGPQCAGMLLGDKSILMSAWQASSPHHGPGRDNKIGREEHIGMLAAVEAWVKRDHAAVDKQRMTWLNTIASKVSGIDSVKTAIREPSGLNNRSSSLSISWDIRKLNITGDEVAEDFALKKPRIAIGSGSGSARTIPGATPGGGAGAAVLEAAAILAAEAAEADLKAGIATISITSSMMQPGDELVVAERLYEILTRKRSARQVVSQTSGKDIVGNWTVTVDYSSGKGIHRFFITRQENNWARGTHQGTFSTQNLAGEVHGDTVRLLSTYNEPGDSIPFIFDGKISGDQINGTVYMGEYLNAKFTAVKDGYQEQKVPVTVPNGGRRSGNSW